MIYLSSPYTHPTKAVQNERFDAVCKAASYFMKRGCHILSPIAHTHPIARYGLPTDWEFWAAYDTACLKQCKVMWVLMLYGWEKSVGVTAEIGIAKDLGMPIWYVKVCADGYTVHVGNDQQEAGRFFHE